MEDPSRVEFFDARRDADLGNVEITAILDVDTSMPLAEVFDGSGDPPPGGSASLAARYPDEFTADAWHFRDHCFLVRMPTA
jgi:hypothetical protein